MKSFLVFCNLLFLNTCFCGAQNQGINTRWQVGYASWAGLPYGGTDIDFFTGTPAITYVNRSMDFSRTICNISDSLGNILFYTNGYDISDSTDTIMLNGNNISPGMIHTADPNGLPVPQACLIIPKPGSNNLYYLLHSGIDDPPNYQKAYYLYYSLIDMNLNGGKGAVTQKNIVIVSDTLNGGKITACKHGNGRDWWVVCHRYNSNFYYKFLITPNGISAPITQSIGTLRIFDAGQVVFSPDGNKFAYFNAYYLSTSTLDIYNFDRCTGNFSNSTSIVIPQSSGLGGGLAFSPNSQYLYMANIDSVYQYDVTALNIESTKIVVAAWDSFYSPSPPFGTYFDMSQLAPDGKIYIGTGNSTFTMHVINYPDSLGLSCNLIQHSFNFPAYYMGGGPNHPNYFLWREFGSPCDTITSWLGASEHPPNKEDIKIFSNPNDGHFTLWFNVHDKQGLLQVYDVNGNLILQEEVAQWSQYKHVDITKQPAGIYFCKMSWGNVTSGSVKVIKE